MKIKKDNTLAVELGKSEAKLVRAVSKRTGLKPEKVLGLILRCEVDIAWYAMSKRLKVFKRLKIEPTVEQLLGIKITPP